MPDFDAGVRRRVMVVEDDERISVNLARSLHAEGYDVDCTSTIGGTREILRAEQTLRREVSLVLLDVGLPDGNGIEFCRELRSTRPDLGVILLITAHSEEIDVVVGFDAGAADYVTKPFRLAELLARIRSRLRYPSLVHRPHDTTEPEAVERSQWATSLSIPRNACICRRQRGYAASQGVRPACGPHIKPGNGDEARGTHA